MNHHWDMQRAVCVYCGLTPVNAVLGQCPGPLSTAQHPTAWGLKPVAAANGCYACSFLPVPPTMPCFTYNVGYSPQPLNAHGVPNPGVIGAVQLCTACAALQPTSLAGPSRGAAMQQQSAATAFGANRAAMQTFHPTPLNQVNAAAWALGPRVSFAPKPQCDCGAELCAALDGDGATQCIKCQRGRR